MNGPGNWITWVVGVALAVALGLGIFRTCASRKAVVVPAVAPADALPAATPTPI